LNEKYANDFFEILTALSENTELKKKVIDLIETRPIMGKALEEQLRKDNFRKIMLNLINEEISNLESIIFNLACILASIFCIFLNLTLSFIFIKNTFAKFGILVGLIGNFGIMGVGIFSINRNSFGFMHEFSTGLAFGGFVLWSFIIGMCIILCSSKVPKKLGWYGVIGPLTTLILFWLFKNPLWEWLLLFSILAFVIPMGFFSLKQSRNV